MKNIQIIMLINILNTNLFCYCISITVCTACWIIQIIVLNKFKKSNLNLEVQNLSCYKSTFLKLKFSTSILKALLGRKDIFFP